MVPDQPEKSGTPVEEQAVNERRKHKRESVDYRVVVRDRLSRIAAMGRAENISEGGFLLVCAHHEYVPRKGRLFVDIHVPDGRQDVGYVERRACRIVHASQRDNGELALGVMYVDQGSH